MNFGSFLFGSVFALVLIIILANVLPVAKCPALPASSPV
jgi:hypothetical protein